MKWNMKIMILMALAATIIFLLYFLLRLTVGPENTKGFSAQGGRYWTTVILPDGSRESFLVDTGAVYSSIRENLAPKTEDRNARNVTVSSVVGKYELRAVDVRNFKFQESNYDRASFLISPTNVIGANVIFARTPMLLTASGVYTANESPPGECIPFKLDYLGQDPASGVAALYLGIEINGKVEYALLDTGGSDYLTGINDIPGFGSRFAVIGNSDNRFSIARYSNETALIRAGGISKNIRHKSYKSGFRSRSKYVLGSAFLRDFDVYLNADARRVCLISKTFRD